MGDTAAAAEQLAASERLVEETTGVDPKAASERLAEETTGVDPKAPARLDCGGVCHNPECERRHLDAEERCRWDKEAGLRYPRKPSLVITASPDMGRTASTWVFNAVRLLYRQGHECCDSYWMRSLSPAELTDRLSTGAHVVVKTHEWTPEALRDMDAITSMFTHVIVSVREGFEPEPTWTKFQTHLTHFEQIVAHDKDGQKIGAIDVLRGLADHLGIENLSERDLKSVDHTLMNLPIPGDQTTKFWSFHGRRGGRPKPTQPPEAE